MQTLLAALALTLAFFSLPARAEERPCTQSVCELDKMMLERRHQWQYPRYSVLEYRIRFSESEQPLAAFMLCNAPGRPRCIEADVELALRFGSEACRALYFVALVDGEGYHGATLMQQSFRVVFAKKAANGQVMPLRVSFPDEDRSPVDCRLIAMAAMRRL